MLALCCPETFSLSSVNDLQCAVLLRWPCVPQWPVSLSVSDLQSVLCHCIDLMFPRDLSPCLSATSRVCCDCVDFVFPRDLSPCLSLTSRVCCVIVLTLCSPGTCLLVCHWPPPWSRLLMPGVFKPSCSTPFTPFLRLVSVYWPFQLYFIPKTPQYLRFQLPSYSLFLPNRPFSCIWK